VHGWGDARFNGAKTVCIVDPDNTGSVNVALKCGYREITRTSYKGSPTILFERERTTA
jgi:RimJ/RimL family protein N-acetyltransferase